MPKLFGRNPAFFAGLTAAVVSVLTQIPELHLSIVAGAAITAFVSAALGFYTAFMTHQTTLAVGTGLAQAFFVLLAAFSLNVSDGLQTAIIAAIPFALGLFQHTQSIPVEGDQQPYFDAAA
jgi:hypothetical protein